MPQNLTAMGGGAGVGRPCNVPRVVQNTANGSVNDFAPCGCQFLPVFEILSTPL